MKTKIAALSLTAFASISAFAGPYVVSGDQVFPASDTTVYDAINYTATAPSTVTIEDGGTIRLSNQSVMLGMSNTNKLTFTGGAMRHTNASGWAAKYLSNYAIDVVFDTDFTYEVSTSTTGNPGQFLLGGGSWNFARDFNFEATGVSSSLYFSLGYVSGGTGGTTTVTMGTNRAVKPGSPEYSMTTAQLSLNNASELIIENNYQVSVTNTLFYADTASTITNKGTFASTPDSTVAGNFINSGSAEFAKKLYVTGTYTNTGSTSSTGIGVNDGGVFNQNGGTISSSITVNSGGVLNHNGGAFSGGLIIQNGGVFNVNTSTNFTWANLMGGSTINMAANVNHVVSLYGDATINVLDDGLSFQGVAWKETGSHTVSIALNGHDLSIGYLIRGQSCTSENLYADFILGGEEWVDNSVKVTDMTLEQLAEVTFKIDGVATDFYFVDAGSANSYYLNLAIPEPSAFAALFGIAALGFAALRRRK